MVELALAEGCIMKKKMMLKKIKGHHHRHGHGHGGKHHHHPHGGDGCGGLGGHPVGVVGSEIVVVLHGKHHHHHHYHHGGPCGMMPAPVCNGEEQFIHHHHHHQHGKHQHHRGHGPRAHRALLESLRGLSHHARRYHRRCARELGFVFHHTLSSEGSGACASEDQQQQQATEAPTAPTVPQAEALMNNLNLGGQTDKEANQQP